MLDMCTNGHQSALPCQSTGDTSHKQKEDWYTTSMQWFLAKTDPETYSVADFEMEKETLWDGVHNYQAIAVIKTMKPKDKVFIYHSQSDKAIMAIAEVSGEPFENTDDPRHSWAVRMKFRHRIEPITLSEMKLAGLDQVSYFCVTRDLVLCSS